MRSHTQNLAVVLWWVHILCNRLTKYHMLVLLSHSLQSPQVPSSKVYLQMNYFSRHLSIWWRRQNRQVLPHPLLLWEYSRLLCLCEWLLTCGGIQDLGALIWYRLQPESRTWSSQISLLDTRVNHHPWIPKWYKPFEHTCSIVLVASVSVLLIFFVL